MILQVDGISKSFGGVQAVTDCSFQVETGSITGLIGPNGAGKSTAINVISGLYGPDQGSVRFQGRDIAGLALHQVSHLGLVRTFQEAREWRAMTVMENMLVAAPSRGRDVLWRAVAGRRRLREQELEDRERARAILERFTLLPLRDDKAGTLSGGQRRLLEFGRVVMAGPTMVLLDEPLAGVNPVLAETIQVAMEEMRSSGITILVVEHRLSFVEDTCDKVVVMALGAVAGEGTMEELRTNEAVLDAYLGVKVDDE
ncbi:MAG: ABC transporter ATP-binding protein [Acidimicrobiales bacterium]